MEPSVLSTVTRVGARVALQQSPILRTSIAILSLTNIKIVPMIALGNKMSNVFTCFGKRPIFRALCFDFKLVMLFLVDTIINSIIYVYIVI